MNETHENSIHIVLASAIREQPQAASQASLHSLSQLRDQLIRQSCQLPVNPLSQAVLTVVTAIWQRLCELDLNVKTLKEECRIHDNNISSTFKREIGQSIKTYIEWKRLEIAVELLEKSHYTVADISYVVGYEHIETFYRVFVRRLKCSPGAYRIRRRARTEASALGVA